MLALAATLAGSIALDAFVRPRPSFPSAFRRTLASRWLQMLMVLVAFGFFQSVTGNDMAAAVLALAMMALLVVVSNAKNRMLGEPLLFSDLVLIVAVFRHPQFYLSALRTWQRIALVVGAVAVIAILCWHSVWSIGPHVIGFCMMVAGIAVLWVTVRTAPVRAIMTEPNAGADLRRHGLLPTLLVYWLRWRMSESPAAALPAQRNIHSTDETPEIVVIVQCESFADPVDLFDNPSLELPSLAAARGAAWQAGRLQVSGFGAYTMRTEYGLLFGRSEKELGFRRYDPFLTALEEVSHALPNRLSAMNWRSVFLHPHDMRFYGRDRIMPGGGFADLVGEDRFGAPSAEEGRYVTDAAMAVEIVSQARSALDRALIYAVTIENHGPWMADGAVQAHGSDQPRERLAQRYLELVRNSDAMLKTLMAQLSTLGRPAMLVFFGDHRPSIPDVSMPGGDRHTPYVVLRFDAQGRPIQQGDREMDLTPAELHHVILNIICGAA